MPRQVLPKIAVGTALSHTLEYWPKLAGYTGGVDCPIDNNVAEYAPRLFVIHHEPCVFSTTQSGAKGREPYQYLHCLYERLQTGDRSDCDGLMPWSAPIT